MRFKKLVCLLLVTVFALCLSGCGSVSSNGDELLSAPKLEGDMYPVQLALEKSAGEKITLKYPTSGEYRSALVLKDLNNDKKNEAVALYSVTVDSTVLMHINVIAMHEDKWESIGDLSLVGNGVESISFSDLDGDGSLEIIVGWIVYGTVEKQVGIYNYEDNTLTQRALEPYTKLLCADITGDKVNDLTIVHLNSSERKSSARVFSLSVSGITELGITPLDGGVSSYSEPVLSKLADGTTAIYIDAVKGNGMLTEIIWLEGGALKGIYDPVAQETSLTYRNNTVSSRDYNDNSVIDIPISELLLSTADSIDADKAYYTNWSEFDGKSLQAYASTFMNYADGYSLTVPEKWKQEILLIRITEARMRFFYSYNLDMKIAGDELFRLVAASTADYKAGKYSSEDYILLSQTDNFVYLALVNPNNSLEITQEDVRSMFSMIK